VLTKRLLVLLAFSLIGPGCRPAANDVGLTFYVQLVRGGDQDTPPVPDAKPIGRKLSQQLRSVFKWKNYWELKRDSIVVRQGQKARRRMSPEREVEIELLGSQRVAARIYANGKLTRSRRQPAEAAFFVAGGAEGENQSWFIVVRRDRPLDSEHN
jgi:hypothetical protein